VILYILIKAYFSTFAKGKLDHRVGVHWSGNQGELARLEIKSGRALPNRRANTKLNRFEIRIPGRQIIISHGNEMNREQGWSVAQIQIHMIDQDKSEYSPALHTLKQWPEWERLFHLWEPEDFISGWCVNTHGPSFVHMRKNIINRIDGMYSWYKRIKHLVKFASMTKLPVVITESGVGQNSELSADDIRLSYSIHKSIFGDRLEALLVYDSAIIGYNDGVDVL